MPPKPQPPTGPPRGMWKLMGRMVDNNKKYKPGEMRQILPSQSSDLKYVNMAGLLRSEEGIRLGQEFARKNPMESYAMNSDYIKNDPYSSTIMQIERDKQSRKARAAVFQQRKKEKMRTFAGDNMIAQAAYRWNPTKDNAITTLKRIPAGSRVVALYDYLDRVLRMPAGPAAQAFQAARQVINVANNPATAEQILGGMSSEDRKTLKQIIAETQQMLPEFKAVQTNLREQVTLAGLSLLRDVDQGQTGLKWINDIVSFLDVPVRRTLYQKMSAITGNTYQSPSQLSAGLLSMMESMNKIRITPKTPKAKTLVKKWTMDIMGILDSVRDMKGVENARKLLLWDQADRLNQRQFKQQITNVNNNGLIDTRRQLAKTARATLNSRWVPLDSDWQPQIWNKQPGVSDKVTTIGRLGTLSSLLKKQTGTYTKKIMKYQSRKNRKDPAPLRGYVWNDAMSKQVTGQSWTAERFPKGLFNPGAVAENPRKDLATRYLAQGNYTSQVMDYVPSMVTDLMFSNETLSKMGLGQINAGSLPLYAGRYIDPFSNSIKTIKPAPSAFINPGSAVDVIANAQAKLLASWNRYVSAEQSLLRLYDKVVKGYDFSGKAAAKGLKMMQQKSLEKSMQSKLKAIATKLYLGQSIFGLGADTVEAQQIKAIIGSDMSTPRAFYQVGGILYAWGAAVKANLSQMAGKAFTQSAAWSKGAIQWTTTYDRSVNNYEARLKLKPFQLKDGQQYLNAVTQIDKERRERSNFNGITTTAPSYLDQADQTAINRTIKGLQDNFKDMYNLTNYMQQTQDRVMKKMKATPAAIWNMANVTGAKEFNMSGTQLLQSFGLQILKPLLDEGSRQLYTPYEAAGYAINRAPKDQRAIIYNFLQMMGFLQETATWEQVIDTVKATYGNAVDDLFSKYDMQIFTSANPREAAARINRIPGKKGLGDYKAK